MYGKEPELERIADILAYAEDERKYTFLRMRDLHISLLLCFDVLQLQACTGFCLTSHVCNKTLFELHLLDR